ncbi:hypothetical protein [Mycolicibacterium phlei]|uniref:hypothetical protein n=1 Tax=Mycolicibacterium phlei TaxID=1771 RepID=UPI00058F905F
MFVRSSLFAAAAVAVGSLIATPAAAAQPGVGCQPALSAPELVELAGGTRAVRASLTMSGCAPNAQPTDVRVCLAPANGNGQCKKLPGWADVQVIIPATPSGVFTATGEACWHEILGSFTSGCRSAGPITATY